MKNKKFAAIALACLALAGTAVAGIEVLGIEVLGIEVLGIEVLGIEVLSTGAPAGSTVTAYVRDGIEVLQVDMQPVDPVTGLSNLTMPNMPEHFQAQLVLRDLAGRVLYEKDGSYMGGLHFE